MGRSLLPLKRLVLPPVHIGTGPQALLTLQALPRVQLLQDKLVAVARLLKPIVVALAQDELQEALVRGDGRWQHSGAGAGDATESSRSWFDKSGQPFGCVVSPRLRGAARTRQRPSGSKPLKPHKQKSFRRPVDGLAPVGGGSDVCVERPSRMDHAGGDPYPPLPGGRRIRWG